MADTYTQLIDYLSSQGMKSSNTALQTYWNDSGLSSRLGSYTGSSSQNSALFDSMQSKSATSTDVPEWRKTLDTVLASASNIKPDPQYATGMSYNIGTTPQQNMTYLSGALNKEGPLTQSGTYYSAQNFVPSSALPQTTAPKTYTTPSGAVVDASGKIISYPPGYNASSPASPPVQSEAYDVRTSQTTGISASSILPPGTPAGSESDFINQFLNSADGQLVIDRARKQGLDLSGAAEVAKQELEKRYAEEKAKVEASLGARGLYLSGIRATQIRALADNLASSQLGVDRELASKLLDANLDLREKILDGVADLIKSATQGAKDARAEALAQLNKAGLAVVGDQVVPTLDAVKEQRIQEQQRVQNELNQAKYELSVAKSQAQMEAAQARLDLAQAKYELTINNQTVGDKKAQAAVNIFQGDIRAMLEGGATPQEVLQLTVYGDGTNPSLASQYNLELDAQQQAAILQAATEMQKTVTVKQQQQPQTEESSGIFSFFKNLQWF